MSEEKDLARQLIVALGVLVLVSFLVAEALLLTEGHVADSLFSNYWNCLLWTAMDYLGNPSGIGDWEIVTSGGRVAAIIVKIIAIALYAAFTGLLVALITAWYKSLVHKAKLKRIHKDLLRAFHRQYERSLSLKHSHNCYIVPSQKLLATLQINANMDLRDIVEVCERYYGFRVKNLANIHSIEDQGVSDRFIVEHFPVNNEYGCCRDRGSNVTIVSPTSDSSVGIGWFSYYLALLGGFNYISKDYDTDPMHRSSYYNFEDNVADAARQWRDAFQKDLEKLCGKENSWVIVLLSFTNSKTKTGDIHLSYLQEDGAHPTVMDRSAYEKVVNDLTHSFMNLKILSPSDTFPLKQNHIMYASRKLNKKVNAFTMRISSSILKADTERLLIAETIAKIFLSNLSNASFSEIPDDTKADLEDKTTETYSLKDWEKPEMLSKCYPTKNK